MGPSGGLEAESWGSCVVMSEPERGGAFFAAQPGSLGRVGGSPAPKGRATWGPEAGGGSSRLLRMHGPHSDWSWDFLPCISPP